MRLDYIFVSPPLLGSLQSAEVVRSEETDRLSDHYPVQAVLRL
jgi:exonuclease III